jgi:hypothetical protein
MRSKDRRIRLQKGVQRQIILDLSEKEGSIKKLAVKIKIPYSTLKNYVLEDRMLPESLFEKLIKMTKNPTEKINVSYLDYNWGQIIGGKLGIKALEKKYPREIKKWRRWAIKKALAVKPNLKEIKKPKINEKLAEFIGIYLGDGTMTKYQVRIIGDSRYDKVYLDYVSNLIFNLFGLKTSFLKHKNTNTLLLVTYSKNLCDFLNKSFNLKPGNKIRNKNIIPKKILQYVNLSIACLRGLIDTDGSISRRGRNGSQFCIQFTSHNKELLEQVNQIGRNLKIFTFSDKTGAGTNKWENIVKYFQIVGSSNPKHIVRFLLRKEGENIYRDDLPYYFKQERYKDLNLPFILKGV